ncbi:hypothetical protein AAZX31_07G245800 [Glycine max]|uniref:Uncharacterized protein n=2 Tax=Glycine subgen. Soja TaxID=1462606 RepID=A0A0R0J8S5_SOYBN|nr:hypothetical protein GLYMA_07G264500v4 [Glycine max]RZC04794.1 hypothetical protein D0Y65_019073 [Glycine soja]
MMKQQRLSTRMRSYSTSSLEQISHDEGRSNTKRHSHHMSKGSYTAESTRVKSDFIGTFSSSNRNIKGRGGSHSLNDHVNHEATIVPEFGEGYTAIFSEVRKEKQIASGHMPSKTPSPNNRSDIRNQCGRPSSFLPKCCCCLFSSESQ